MPRKNARPAAKKALAKKRAAMNSKPAKRRPSFGFLADPRPDDYTAALAFLALASRRRASRERPE